MSLTTAREVLLKDEAGLILQGREDDGELMWCGTNRQWSDYEYLMDKAMKDDGDSHFLDEGF